MGQHGRWEERPWEAGERDRDQERWRYEARRHGEHDQWRRERGEEHAARDEWRGEYRGYGDPSRREWRDEYRPEVDPPWVERGPEGRRGRGDTRGLVEWEDRGPIKWLGDKFREATGRPSRGPKGYTRSDERIFDDVCERIARSGVDADDVEVKVEKREVTLTGTVRSRAEKWRLEEVAEDVFGVEDVHNHLRVRRVASTETGRTDPGTIEDPSLRH